MQAPFLTEPWEGMNESSSFIACCPTWLLSFLENPGTSRKTLLSSWKIPAPIAFPSPTAACKAKAAHCKVGMQQNAQDYVFHMSWCNLKAQNSLCEAGLLLSLWDQPQCCSTVSWWQAKPLACCLPKKLQCPAFLPSGLVASSFEWKYISGSWSLWKSVQKRAI